MIIIVARLVASALVLTELKASGAELVKVMDGQSDVPDEEVSL